jgi:hypothetical protein
MCSSDEEALASATGRVRRGMSDHVRYGGAPPVAACAVAGRVPGTRLRGGDLALS